MNHLTFHLRVFFFNDIYSFHEISKARVFYIVKRDFRRSLFEIARHYPPHFINNSGRNGYNT